MFMKLICGQSWARRQIVEERKRKPKRGINGKKYKRGMPNLESEVDVVLEGQPLDELLKGGRLDRRNRVVVVEGELDLVRVLLKGEEKEAVRPR